MKYSPHLKIQNSYNISRATKASELSLKFHKLAVSNIFKEFIILILCDVNFLDTNLY